MNQEPPLLARKILQCFVHIHYLEEIEGDLAEVFNNNRLQKGFVTAHVLYWVHVFRAIRFYPVKRSPSRLLHEIRHFVFLKLAFRNIWKRRYSHAINTLGLVAAIVSFMLIYRYVQHEKSFDRFHTHFDRLGRVGFDWGEIDEQGENQSIYASNVPAMGRILAAEVPEIEAYTTFVPLLTVKKSCYFRKAANNDLLNADNGLYTDDKFLSVFSFPVRASQDHALANPHSVAITASFAKKIFGEDGSTDVIGKEVIILTDKEEPYTVTALLDDVPLNSHIQFDYLISYATIHTPALEQNIYWSQFYTYVLMRNKTVASGLDAKFSAIVEKIYGKESHVSLFWQSLADIHLGSNVREELHTPGSRQTVDMLTLVAWLIVLIGWFNFTNLFLAQAMERTKEVGIKKTLGSTRVALVMQFLSESVLISLLNILVSAGVYFWIEPFVTAALGVGAPARNFYSDIGIVLSGVLVLGSLIAGAFPAILLSAYNPLKAMGKQLRDMPLQVYIKNGLIYFQFTVCFTVLASAWIMGRQLTFMQNADLGITVDRCISIRLPSIADPQVRQGLRRFKEILAEHDRVGSVTVSSTIPGSRIVYSGGVQRTSGPTLEGNNVLNVYADEDFISTFGITLLAGRNFEPAVSDSVPHVLLNEAAVGLLRFKAPEEAIGQHITWRKETYFVEGVFKNYNHLFQKETFEPMMVTQSTRQEGFVTVHLKATHQGGQDALSLLRQAWTAAVSTAPFDFLYLDRHYDRQYSSLQREYTVIQTFAGLALMISMIGLFSLSAYSVRKRFREIAVRKVFGAGAHHLFAMLIFKQAPLVLISAVAGAAITFMLMTGWLQNFAFSISLRSLDFICPLVVISGTTTFVIAYFALQVMLLNPTQVLRSE